MTFNHFGLGCLSGDVAGALEWMSKYGTTLEEMYPYRNSSKVS